ncbi:unnamed protein product [Sphagnum troendelagicum]|uniref:P53 and DNA damage-regulated protein 1 n=1 Tax=Sphagnum troendelagicum TaxID=128251 RepID=A0ABP0TBY0_9BRYO
MDGVQLLQKKLAEVEHVAEKLFLARQQLVECDKARNGNREALTALRKQARTSRSSVSVSGKNVGGGGGGGGDSSAIDSSSSQETRCRTCGDHDGSSRVWMMSSGTDMLIRLPFHSVHCELEQEQQRLEDKVKMLQSTVKDKTLELSDTGALSQTIGPNLLRAFVNLKDNSS